MERQDREYIEYLRYQEFLDAKRRETADPLGQRAIETLFAPLGVPVSRFETVVPVERISKETEPLSEKFTRPLGAVTLRSLPHEQPPLDTRVLTGYGSKALRPDAALAA